MKKKKIFDMPGLRDIKSMHIIGARSIPKAQRSSYLELYILDREKERLDKELFALDKRNSSANKKLDIINNRIEKLQREIKREQRKEIRRNYPAKPLKKMTMHY